MQMFHITRSAQDQVKKTERAMDYNYLSSHIFSLILAFTLIPLVYLLLKRKPKNLLPPGPFPLPIIGNIHLLDVAKPHQSLTMLSQKHGPIMCLKLGQITTIIISSSSIAKEVLQKQDFDFCNRYVINAGEALNHDQYSVIWLPVSSPRWRLHRKILNTNFFSSTKLDANKHLRLKKIEELIQYCNRKCQAGEAVNINAAVLTTILNLLSNMIFSKDFSDPFHLESDDEFKKLIRDVLEITGKNNMVDLFPMFRKFDPQGIKRRMTYLLGKCRKFFGGLIDERLEHRKNQKNIVFNDLLDSFLWSCDQEEYAEEFNTDQIWHLCVDLFVAGFDSIANTTEWAMAELLSNPEILKRSKEELTKIVGKSKQLKDEDIARLHYLSSIIKETLRLHPATALLIPRKIEKTIEISGYTIPKKSQVLVNVWAIARDPKNWEHDSKFKPEFFLQSDIDFRGQNFELIPFGAGRGMCPGLPLASRMLACILGSLLNSFEWKLDGNMLPQELNMEEGSGLTLPRAHPFKVVPFPL